MAQSVYSSHDWRKNTASAVVMNADTLEKMQVNDCIVRFIDPTNLKETEVDLSRLVRVFVTNKESNRKSVK